MRTIKEMIVVEGKNDTLRLKRYFNCDTIETGGDHVSKQTLDRIEEAQRRRGVIVFTDPDHAGSHIRQQILKRVPDAKQAFISRAKAHTDKKVGVEHALEDDLWNSLKNSVTFMDGRESLSHDEFIDLGLVGNKAHREKVCESFHIGHCNAKTCFKRLNQLGITADEIREKLS